MLRNLVRGMVATAAVASALALQAAPAQAACSPLACSEILVDLPNTLDFSSDHGKIVDGNGVGTGFTYVQPTTNGTGYIPANLLVGAGLAPSLWLLRRTPLWRWPALGATVGLGVSWVVLLLAMLAPG